MAKTSANIPILDRADHFHIDWQTYLIDRRASEKPWSFYRHTHKGFCEFVYPIQGSIVNNINTTPFKQAPGDLILIREHDTHDLKGSDFIFYNINFDLTDLLKLCDLLHIDAYTNTKLRAILFGSDICHYTVPADRHNNLSQTLSDLFEHQQTPFGHMLFHKFLISVLVDFIITPPKTTIAPHTLPPWLEQLLDLIDKRIDQGITTQQLPDLCDRSHEHIARIFRKHLSCTPSQYLNDARLTRAALLLTHSNQPIIDIALTVGFNNLNYFYKLFHDKYHLPPSHYRKQSHSVT
ncbi:helix-turn-helix domain-containing protein [Planctomycetota bacterium]|nr:helix-turn-helix domain-containing protein [Planctomycetota bacterium]